MISSSSVKNGKIEIISVVCKWGCGEGSWEEFEEERRIYEVGYFKRERRFTWER